MRVISGAARGRLLRATGSTRPTADMIKGAIFSMLEALAYKRGFEPDEEGVFAAAQAWPRVLDLFAGSGALAIEALSRGAESAELIEQDREAARIMQANLRAADVSERARVHVAPVESALSRVRGPIDVVFADPPYAQPAMLVRTAELLSRSDLLMPSSVVVLEHAATAPPPPVIGSLAQVRTRRHGRTGLTLYAAPDANV